MATATTLYTSFDGTRDNDVQASAEFRTVYDPARDVVTVDVAIYSTAVDSSPDARQTYTVPTTGTPVKMSGGGVSLQGVLVRGDNYVVFNGQDQGLVNGGYVRIIPNAVVAVFR